jgi:hypothetical protein
MRGQIAQIQLGHAAAGRELLEIRRTEADADSSVDNADGSGVCAFGGNSRFELRRDPEAFGMREAVRHQRRFERNDGPPCRESLGDWWRDNELSAIPHR